MAITDAVQFTLMAVTFMTVPFLIKAQYHGYWEGIFGTVDDPSYTPSADLDGYLKPPGTNCNNHQVWDSPIGKDADWAKENYDNYITPAPFAFASSSGLYKTCWREVPRVQWAREYDTTAIPCNTTDPCAESTTSNICVARAANATHESWIRVDSGCVALTNAW